MKIKTLKTHLIEPGASLYDILDQYVSSVKEGMILGMTSKILSLCQGRVVPKSSVSSKYALVVREADAYLEEDQCVHDAHLTIKHNILIPSAGIDESNGNGMYILYPCNIQEVATDIWKHMRQKHGLHHFGVIITDSHTTPLRKGVTGIALGWCGFEPLHSYVGASDIFGQPLRVTQINILDALASTCVFMMGEGAEQTPLALMEDVPKLRFLSRAPTLEEEKLVSISLEEDLYAPLLKNAHWIWNQKETGFKGS